MSSAILMARCETALGFGDVSVVPGTALRMIVQLTSNERLVFGGRSVGFVFTVFNMRHKPKKIAM